nr:reverse transcriptase domain-containing protein [Tanacetum cinerariifolium]
MRTRSSSNLPVVSLPNPSTSNPKHRNRRRSKQPFILEESPIDTMADQCTMAELLRAPTEGYAEAIVVLPILAEQFELKHSLINMMTSDQTTNLHNEISNFQQRFDESFHEAWDRYKDLLYACPHHGFTELHQLDTFYNALNPADQYSLNAAAGGNLLERRTQDVLTTIENKSKVFNSRNKSVVSQVKSCDANSNSSLEIAKLTHAVNQQTSAVTTVMKAIRKQFQATPPPAFVKAVEEICVTCGGAHLYYQCLAAGGNTFPELKDNIQGYVAAAAVNYNHGNSVYRPLGSGSLPSNTVANPKGELKAITTRIGIVLDGPFVPTPPPFINQEVDEHVDETLTDQDLFEYTIKVPPPLVQKYKPPSQRDFVLHINITLADALIPGIARDIFVLVGKFTFPADFVIVDYESDPRVPFILGRPFLRTARALIDVHGEEMILHDGGERLTLNMRHDTSSYSHQPQKESINLANVFNDSSEDFIEDLFSTNQLSGNPTFPSHPELTSPKVKDNIFDLEGGNVLPKKLLDLDSTKELRHPFHVNPLSGSTTYFSSPNQLLEEFSNELSLITFPPKYDDDLQSDIESDLKEIESLLYRDPIKDIDSSLKDSIDQSNLANLNNNLVDSMPEMFTDEHALDYSSLPLFDEYDDDLFEVESDTENVYDDPFDSKGEKIKESKLLIDELDLPCDFLPPSEYDSILSVDFSRVDALPSTNNEDKVFNPCILIQENLFEIITRVVQDKKLAISHSSLMIKDLDPPLYELPFFKEVPRSNMVLLFSSKNEENIFKPRIHISGKVYSSLIPELSHQGYKVFKINQIFKSSMKNFLFPCGKDTHILAVLCLHFYPLDQF